MRQSKSLQYICVNLFGGSFCWTWSGVCNCESNHGWCYLQFPSLLHSLAWGFTCTENVCLISLEYSIFDSSNIHSMAIFVWIWLLFCCRLTFIVESVWQFTYFECSDVKWLRINQCFWVGWSKYMWNGASHVTGLGWTPTHESNVVRPDVPTNKSFSINFKCFARFFFSSLSILQFFLQKKKKTKWSLCHLNDSPASSSNMSFYCSVEHYIETYTRQLCTVMH